jgi:3-deoxy-D-manno-octulosonic-acid transferase
VSLILYRLFLWLYRLGISLVSPWNPKAKAWIQGRSGIFEKISQTVPGSESRPTTLPSTPELINQNSELKTRNPELIWVHCASLGEFEQGRPLIEDIKAQYPGCRIFLTFFSPSGYEIRKDYAGADYIFYLPADSPAHARRLLDIINPTLVLWVKYEYWYYYLTEIHRRNIPLLLVSGIFREDQPFFKWYGHLYRKLLKNFTHFFVQTDDSKELLGTIGYRENITVSGDTRFDRVIAIAEQFQPISVVESFIGNALVIVAGSTWEEDEEELDHYANTHPEIKFIIAPHEIDEEHILQIEKLFHYSVRYSQLQAHSSRFQVPGSTSPDSTTEPQTRNPGPGTRNYEPNVLIIDNIGLLSKLYKYATITYVGGGFGYDGVHNVLEAAVYGKPVVFGPEYEKYAEAIGLVENGGAFSIDNALELEKQLNVLLENAAVYEQSCVAAKTFVYANKGATEKILDYIQEKRLLTK